MLGRAIRPPGTSFAAAVGGGGHDAGLLERGISGAANRRAARPDRDPSCCWCESRGIGPDSSGKPRSHFVHTAIRPSASCASSVRFLDRPRLRSVEAEQRQIGPRFAWRWVAVCAAISGSLTAVTGDRPAIDQQAVAVADFDLPRDEIAQSFPQARKRLPRR